MKFSESCILHGVRSDNSRDPVFPEFRETFAKFRAPGRPHHVTGLGTFGVSSYMHRPLRPRSLGSRPPPRMSSKSLPSFQTAANAVLKQLQLLDTLPDCLLPGLRRARAVYHRDSFEVTWCRISPNSRGICPRSME